MDKKFFLVDNGVRGLKFGVFLERTEFGSIGIVNSHFNLTEKYELLLSDSDGENFYGEISENPYVFSLPEGFNILGDVLVDVFLGEELIASNSPPGVTKPNAGVDEWLDETSKNYPKDNFREVQDFISRAQKLYSKERPSASFKDKIGEDFDLLYSAGTDDFLLAKKFKNSAWRRVDVGDEVYILGKIYAGKSLVGEDNPSFVAIAIPTTKERAESEKELGEMAKFYHANIYDNFGFLVLVQNAETGRAVSL